jgi:DNA-binding NtrC family response regulator
MLVEDDEAFSYLVQRGIVAAGHEVSSFADGLGALTSLESGVEIDLLVTDLRLPSGTPNGVSLGQMASLRRPALKIVYMTAFADVAAAARDNAPKVVLKNDDGSKVLAAIESALADRSAEPKAR